MRINPLSLQLRQAEVMDELRAGVAIRNGFDMAEIEFREFFGRNFPVPLTQCKWSRQQQRYLGKTSGARFVCVFLKRHASPEVNLQWARETKHHK
jgi:hypothetical protein